MPIYSLLPQDTLRFASVATEVEDGNPDYGHWPSPSAVFDALHAALHRSYPQLNLWEHTHAIRVGDQVSARSQRFGSLSSIGPFPAVSDGQYQQWLFPGPRDVVMQWRAPVAFLNPLTKAHGRSDLPAPLRYPLGKPVLGSPPSGQLWWTKTAIEDYLKAALADSSRLWPAEELYAVEPHGGREVNPGKPIMDLVPAGTPVTLRLREGVSLGCWATMPLADGRSTEGLDRFATVTGVRIVIGGRQRASLCQQIGDASLDALLPISAPITGEKMKWFLLSPAVYPAIRRTHRRPEVAEHPGGWLPNWICPKTGRVLLKKGDFGRAPGEDRVGWRRRVRAVPETFDCQLVAARVPAPWLISGWSDRRHLVLHLPEVKSGPKPSWVAVPPGSVYYFEGPDAALLADALSWHGRERQTIHTVRNRRSTLFGEKGFGIGVCGPWKDLDESADPPEM